MSANDRFERRLPVILDSIAPMRAPDYFDDILGQVDRTRQRPGWTFPERWIPVSAITNRLAVAPRVPMRAVLVMALLIVGLVIGAVLLAGSQPRVPLPFGPAANGELAFVDPEGAINGLSVDGTSTVLVPGPGNQRPIFSPDGSRLAYLRSNAIGNLEIFVAAADGSDARAITTEPLLSVGHLGWSPDSQSVVAATAGSLYEYDAKGAAPPTKLNAEIRLGNTMSGLDDFNANLSDLFRPPDGNEIAYLGNGPGGPGLYRQSLAGGDPIGLLTSFDSTTSFADLTSVEWSPDGQQLTVALSDRTDGTGARLYVLNADGSDIRRLSRFEALNGLVDEEHATWSPDGKSIAFNRWIEPNAGGVNVRPVVVVDVATGDEREVGKVNVNGYAGWGWSPDGKSIVMVPAEPSPDADQVLLVDAITGEVTRTGVQASSAPSWQRKAP